MLSSSHSDHNNNFYIAFLNDSACYVPLKIGQIDGILFSSCILEAIAGCLSSLYEGWERFLIKLISVVKGLLRSGNRKL